MVRLSPNRWLRAGTLFVALVLSPAAGAQGLGLGLDLGGLDVDVNVGGGKGLDVDVGLDSSDGDDVGLDLDLGGGGAAPQNASTSPDPLDAYANPDAMGQKDVLAAVQSRRALPLEDILTRARLVTDGEVIDAQLITLRGTLLYKLKVLGKAGDVSQLYFYARSGVLLETN